MSRLAVIVAVAENGVIGCENDLPWRLSADLKRFKALTMGSPIIMGRKTWDSIGRPLPGRRSIVLSRNPALSIEGVDVVPSLAEALALVAEAETAFVIGGHSLFAEALPRADVLHLTRVGAEVEGDVRFPDVDWSAWRLERAESHEADEKNEHPYAFLDYHRA